MSRRTVLGAAATAAATAALFIVSRGGWSDALIDSGREWIVPDALARGDLLYRDVVYWFGPFTPYFQAAFLRAFGSSFTALVVAGAVAGLVVLALLFAVLRRIVGRYQAGLWAALAIPVLLFMPNAGGVLLGMGYRIWHAAGFALAGVLLASGAGRSRSRALAAGVCAGLAGLCRTEWGLVAAAAAGLACLVRPRRRRDGLADGMLVGVAYVAAFGAGLGYFLVRAGAAAVLDDGHVLLTGLPAETRHFLLAFSGLPDWRYGIPELLYSAAMWTGVFLLVSLLARRAGSDRRNLLGGLAAVCAVLAATALAGGAGSAVLYSAAPLVCLTALAAGLGRRHGSPAAALAACGFLGLVLSYRRLFHIGDSAYVGPPLIFALISAAGLLRLTIVRRRRADERWRLAAALRWTVAAFVVLAFAGRFWQYASIEAVPIAGTAGMLSAGPSTARELEELSAAIRSATPPGTGLVVFPEGEVLNFLSGRPNPIRHKLYLPGYLTADNEAPILQELARARPAAIVLWRRPVSEYDRGLFGEDYGHRIREWIAANYVRREPTSGAALRRHERLALYILRE
jgi:hypothetical protein